MNKLLILAVSVVLAACSQPQWTPNQPEVVSQLRLNAFAIDTDPSAGKDPDDRLAALLLKEVGATPRVVTTINGNTNATKAYANARMLWDTSLVVMTAPECDGPMVQRLAAQLQRERLTLLALGPVTNIATLLRCEPTLKHRIKNVIVVAGRRAGEEFWLSPNVRIGRPMKDLNYETDRAAMHTLLTSGVPVSLVPFAAGNSVAIHPAEVPNLPAEELEFVRKWASTLAPIGGRGTIPAFDPVATALMLWPQEFACQPVHAKTGDDLVVTGARRSHIRWCLPKKPTRVHNLIVSTLY